MSKIQILDGFKYNTEKRNDEIFNTIKWNSNIFDKIYVLCENSDYYKHYQTLQSNVIEVINLNRDGFVSMQEMVEFVNDKSKHDDIKFLSNLDSIFTSQINELDVEDGCVYTFTNRSMRNPNINNGIGHESYIREDNDGLILFNRDNILDPNWFMKNSELVVYWQNAVCGWVWKEIKELVYDKKCFQCYPQAEQCLMKTFRDTGYNLKSASIKYPTYHNHGSNEKTENNEHYSGYIGIINELL